MTWISRLRPPRMLTLPTPSTRSRIGSIWSSINSRNFTGSKSDAHPNNATGADAASNFISRGRSTSSGKALTIRSIRSRTSFVAASMSVPHSKETRTVARPSDELERISFTPGTALTPSSIGRVTSSSTSSGLASSYVADTVTAGNVISGIISTGSFINATSPKIMTIKEIMVTKIGRLMEKLAMADMLIYPQTNIIKILRKASFQ